MIKAVRLGPHKNCISYLFRVIAKTEISIDKIRNWNFRPYGDGRSGL